MKANTGVNEFKVIGLVEVVEGCNLGGLHFHMKKKAKTLANSNRDETEKFKKNNKYLE